MLDLSVIIAMSLIFQATPSKSGLVCASVDFFSSEIMGQAWVGNTCVQHKQQFWSPTNKSGIVRWTALATLKPEP